MSKVAPLAGAWIEIIYDAEGYPPLETSLPSRERGLKSLYQKKINTISLVAPLAGAWIEIEKKKVVNKTAKSRSPRGSVD